MELFEYDSSAPPVVEQLGPDTLRIGRRVVPTVVERTRRAGSDEWPIPGDRGYVNRPLLTQTFWRNAAVPITGFARSLFQVTMERVPAPAGDSTATSTATPADSAARQARDRVPRAAPDSGSGGPAPFFTKTELELVDLGADATPEVTQAPEDSPPPGGSSPGIVR